MDVCGFFYMAIIPKRTTMNSDAYVVTLTKLSDLWHCFRPDILHQHKTFQPHVNRQSVAAITTFWSTAMPNPALPPFFGIIRLQWSKAFVEPSLKMNLLWQSSAGTKFLEWKYTKKHLFEAGERQHSGKKARWRTRNLFLACPSVYTHGTLRLHLDEFFWNLIFEKVSKTCQENWSLIRIWQK